MDSTSPVRASQITNMVPCADASLNPSGAKVMALTWPWGAIIVHLHVRRPWGLLTHSVMACTTDVFSRWAQRTVLAGSGEASCSPRCTMGHIDGPHNKGVWWLMQALTSMVSMERHESAAWLRLVYETQNLLYVRAVEPTTSAQIEGSKGLPATCLSAHSILVATTRAWLPCKLSTRSIGHCCEPGEKKHRGAWVSGHPRLSEWGQGGEVCRRFWIVSACPLGSREETPGP